jgi:hypothetical protein
MLESSIENPKEKVKISLYGTYKCMKRADCCISF